MGYRINPDDAMTELYGIGKGAAQVIDIQPTLDRMEHQRARAYQSQQDAMKKKDTKEAQVNKSVQDLSSIAIYQGHRPDFAAKQKQLTDFVYENIDRIKGGDEKAVMEYQNLYGDLRTNAELSKNFREQKERLGLEIAKDPKKYRDESIQYYLNSGRNEDGSMNFELDPNKLVQNTNLMNDFRTNVRPIIEDMAKGKSYTYEDAEGNEYGMDINSFSPDKAKVLLHDRLKDPLIANQAAYDFSKLPAEEQGKYDNDFSEYYVQKMLPLATIDQNKVVNRKKESKDYKFANNTWENDHYAWTYNQGEIAKDSKPAPGFQEGDTYEEISLSNRKSETENKPVLFTQANGETTYGVPKGLIKKKGWDMWRVSIADVDKKTGKLKTDSEGRPQMKYVPLKNNTAKIKGEYGFDPETAIHQIKGGAKEGKTVSRSKIKSLVGQKGYEGYTEDELAKYYTDQGYSIQ